jgi:hypothetical protein
MQAPARRWKNALSTFLWRSVTSLPALHGNAAIAVEFDLKPNQGRSRPYALPCLNMRRVRVVAS